MLWCQSTVGVRTQANGRPHFACLDYMFETCPVLTSQERDEYLKVRAMKSLPHVGSAALSWLLSLSWFLHLGGNY